MLDRGSETIAFKGEYKNGAKRTLLGLAHKMAEALSQLLDRLASTRQGRLPGLLQSI